MVHPLTVDQAGREGGGVRQNAAWMSESERPDVLGKARMRANISSPARAEGRVGQQR